MKKFVAIGALALAGLALAQQHAWAWKNSSLSIGLSWHCQSGGNNLFWGTWVNGQVPSPPGWNPGTLPVGRHGGGYGGGYGAPMGMGGMGDGYAYGNGSPMTDGYAYGYAYGAPMTAGQAYAGTPVTADPYAGTTSSPSYNPSFYTPASYPGYGGFDGFGPDFGQ